jgi:phage baseplate assembly protein W
MPATYSWPLSNPPASVVGGGDVPAAVAGVDASSSYVTIRGLLRPFVRDGVSDFASGTGSRLIASKVGQIVGTRCSSETFEGELPWRPEFGSLVHLVRHSNDTAITRELSRVYAEDALRRWFPSIRVREVDVFGSDETGIDGSCVIRIHYELRSRAGVVTSGTADIAQPVRS